MVGSTDFHEALEAGRCGAGGGGGNESGAIGMNDMIVVFASWHRREREQRRDAESGSADNPYLCFALSLSLSHASSFGAGG
jgi:hypothetical protein